MISRTINNPALLKKRKSLRNNMPKPEQKMWYYLRNKQIKGIKFRRQVSIGSYIVDFFSFEKKLVIEIDGDSHFLSDTAEQYDAERTTFLESEGYYVLRFTNTDVMENIEACIKQLIEVIEYLDNSLTPPNLPPDRVRGKL